MKHQPQPAAAAPAGPTDTTIRFGPLKIRGHWDTPPQQVIVEDNEEFARKYTVWAADPNAVRPSLKPKLIERLVEMDQKNLRIKRWRKWLFIHGLRTTQVPPDEFPAILDEAVQLARAIVQ